MIAFVGYVLLVSLLLVTAATASETFLRATHRPTRSVWLAAILATCMLALSVMRVTPSTAVAHVTTASIPGIVGTSGSTDVTDVSPTAGALPVLVGVPLSSLLQAIMTVEATTARPAMASREVFMRGFLSFCRHSSFPLA